MSDSISKNLLSELNKLMKNLQEHKNIEQEQTKKINESISDLKFKLSDIQEKKVSAMINGTDTGDIDVREENILKQIALLNTKKQSISNGENTVVLMKLKAMVPEIIKAQEEEKEFNEEHDSKAESINQQIIDLQKQKAEILSEIHPFYHCRFTIRELEDLTHTARNTIYSAVQHEKGLDKIENPYFGDDK